MTDKKTRVVSNLLSLVLGAGIGAGVYAIKDQITRGGNERIELEAPTEIDGGGVILNESEGNGMQLTATKLSSSEYAENGVSAQAESAYTLTATVMPELAENKAVDWAVRFSDSAAEWASGKSVTDYVTITPSADGALTASLACIKDFGSQIVVTVTSRDNPSAKAECTVDYAKKIKSAYLMDGSGAPIGQNGADWVTGLYDNFTETYIPQYMSYTVNYTYSEYTVEDTFEMTASAQLNGEFKSGLQSYVNSHATEQTQYAAAILGSLSGEKKNPINTGNSWYYTASAFGIFEFILCELFATE